MRACLILLLACGACLDPLGTEEYRVVVYGFPHSTWLSYSCVATVELSPVNPCPGCGNVSGSLTVGAGVSDSMVFSVDPGEYNARFVAGSTGQPSVPASAPVQSSKLEENAVVTVPGRRRLDCP